MTTFESSIKEFYFEKTTTAIAKIGTGVETTKFCWKICCFEVLKFH